MDMCLYLSAPNERCLAAPRAGTRKANSGGRDFNVLLNLPENAIVNMFCVLLFMRIYVYINKKAFKKKILLLKITHLSHCVYLSTVCWD